MQPTNLQTLVAKRIDAIKKDLEYKNQLILKAIRSLEETLKTRRQQTESKSSHCVGNMPWVADAYEKLARLTEEAKSLQAEKESLESMVSLSQAFEN